MGRTQKRILSIVGLAGTFLLGFFLRSYTTEGGRLVYAAERSDTTAVGAVSDNSARIDEEVGSSVASSEATGTMHYLPIIIRSGSLSIEFPIEFQLEDKDNVKYRYIEKDSTSHISGIRIMYNNSEVFKVGRKPGQYTIEVEYEHGKERKRR